MSDTDHQGEQRQELFFSYSPPPSVQVLPWSSAQSLTTSSRRRPWSWILWCCSATSPGPMPTWSGEFLRSSDAESPSASNTLRPRWKDGCEVVPSDNVTLQAEGTMRRLIIRSAEASDAGSYVCRAGSSGVEFSVSVRGTLRSTRPFGTETPLFSNFCCPHAQNPR